MSSALFDRVMIPIDFAPANDGDSQVGYRVSVGNTEVVIGPTTIRALKLAGKLSQGGTLRLIHATPALDHHTVYGSAVGIGVLGNAIDEIHRASLKASIEVMDQLAEKFCPGLNTETSARPGHVLQIILEESALFKADVLVLAASGRSRAIRFVMGSTLDRIIREATCPVMVVPNCSEDAAKS